MKEAIDHRQLETVEHLVTGKMLPDGMTKKMPPGAIVRFYETSSLDLKVPDDVGCDRAPCDTPQATAKTENEKCRVSPFREKKKKRF